MSLSSEEKAHLSSLSVSLVYLLGWRYGTLTEDTCTIACWNVCNHEDINAFYFKAVLLSLRKRI